MIKREYEMMVTHKRETKGDYREIAIQPNEADFSVPYWIARAPMGDIATLRVTPEEFNVLNVGDLVKITILIG